MYYKSTENPVKENIGGIKEGPQHPGHALCSRRTMAKLVLTFAALAAVAFLAVFAEEDVHDISTFKLGEGPVEEALAEGETEAPETEAPPAAAAELPNLGNLFNCVRKKPTLTCPDNDIQYYLYSGEAKKVKIDVTSEEWFAKSGFDSEKPTVFLFHGYQGGENVMPTVILRDAYIKNGSYNLITADYPTLVKERCDRAAQQNAEPIAKCTAAVFDYFQQRGVATEEFTCVGFSLGAHICGLVANFIPKKMSRIVALDPAGARFNRRNTNKRLDEADAEVVHAVHTDTRRYGEGEVVGKADVCVNNGKQPACKDAQNRQLCSHASSVCYFSESLFPGHERKAEPCLNRCPQPLRGTKREAEPVIFGASMDESATGMYCLNTEDAPYCAVARDAEFGDLRCCIKIKK
ncbi:phospholipase A1-like [Neocloeon triangulifer]|uniref:phospholipase A1-like n=1 Tax=Neocloeon triangulifer TaxID=2078957 RepID=UPI00286F0DE0|nr:phospholipase A1-like [Neocloeon triangulifer]